MQEIFVIMVVYYYKRYICGSLTEIVKQKKEIVPTRYEDYNINMDEDIETHCACGHGGMANSPVILTVIRQIFDRMRLCVKHRNNHERRRKRNKKKKSRGKKKERKGVRRKIRAYQEKQNKN
jgi:hypothetical protein